MDAIPYFLTTNLLANAILAIIAFLLGLWTGWCVFAHRETRGQLKGKAPSKISEPEQKQVLPDVAKPSIKDLKSVPTEAEEVFKDELANGNVELDEKLGVVFSSAPEVKDDLTQIKGVASALQCKLNDFGVYQFRQVATWQPNVITEFSERLSFKDRVVREDWVGQARKFHAEKYGEEL